MWGASIDLLGRSACVAALAGLLGTAAQADTLIVGNLSEPIRAATPIGTPQYWSAQSFSADTAYDLTTIAALMGNATGAVDLVIELRSSNAFGEIDLGAGGLLASFTAPDLSGPASVRNFSPSSPVSLSAGAQYWFVVGVDSGAFDWFYANSNDYAGPGDLLSFAHSDDAGATWIYGTEFPHFLEVRGNVPEPAALSLLALGLGGLALRGRRRGKR